MSLDQNEEISKTRPESVESEAEVQHLPKFSIDVVTREVDGKQHNLLYQVKRQDPTKPIVSFFPFSEPKSEGGIDKHIFPAWSGARTSRTRKSYEEIFDEVLELVQMDPVAAARKIKEFGLDYGHQSILGMIPVFLFFNNISLEQAYWIFHHLWYGDGQESSSRYIKFNKMNFPRIEDLMDFSVIPAESEADKEHIIEQYYELLAMAEGNYVKWYQLIEQGYLQQFAGNPEDEPLEDSTIKARVLDVVRSWIPMGATTSMCLLGNQRIFNNYIKIMQETGEQEYVELAEQLRFALSLSETEEGQDVNANLEPLIKYTDPTLTIRENVSNLRAYLEAMPAFNELLEGAVPNTVDYARQTEVTLIDGAPSGALVAMQYICTAYPNLKESTVLSWLATLDDQAKREIGSIIFQNHTRHEKMGNLGDIRGDKLFVLNTALAQLRDFNRHRALGRQDIGYLLNFDYNENDQVDYEAMIANGFNTSSKIIKTEGLQHLQGQWEADANAYYQKLMEFYKYLAARFPNKDLTVIRKLLPLGHQTRMHLSGPPTQLDYFTDQRSTTGNDISNRDMAHDMLTLIQNSDPFLVGMTEDISAPDYNSRQQFSERT